MLTMRNIKKIYRTDTIETHALADFSLHVEAGEFVSVMGPSGSGKTTFLNVAGLLDTFESGTYTAPYNTILEGVNLVPVDNFVVIKPGNYDEATPWSNINKKMHWDAIDGGVTIH